ncbi:N-methyl-L-tryptophan oxidase [Lentzea sp. NEAU-D7]|uniref:N-methyl-L-tryptophan oxidase n=1 Tax=Lentzea sp. NEAU-D7 TaxID=2994667 RepID=UPI00224AD22B|nr:N-methyl-L-tryptophan oxidase [Lentzea sp. NEAU-D7]MCX2954276.1 N-methyl-L-tryptophan oxidase [Lentzea sp. NEAU-D7]
MNGSSTASAGSSSALRTAAPSRAAGRGGGGGGGGAAGAAAPPPAGGGAPARGGRAALCGRAPHRPPASQIRERFPALRPAPDEIGLYEPGAGFVVPEASVEAHLALARRAGADLRFEEPVTHWEPGRVTTARGTYETGHVVLCPGPWAPELLGDLGIPFEVERQVQFYFTPDETLAGYPVYIWDRDTGFYGFPEHDGAVKVAFHHGGEICTPETVDRTVRAHEVEAIANATRSPMPGLAGTFQRAATCMYTNTADRHFVIARHPEHDDVTVACGFSGHGFKFAPVVGEILADLTIDGATRHPIALFDPARLRGGA